MTWISSVYSSNYVVQTQKRVFINGCIKAVCDAALQLAAAMPNTAHQTSSVSSTISSAMELLIVQEARTKTTAQVRNHLHRIVCSQTVDYVLCELPRKVIGKKKTEDPLSYSCKISFRASF